MTFASVKDDAPIPGVRTVTLTGATLESASNRAFLTGVQEMDAEAVTTDARRTTVLTAPAAVDDARARLDPTIRHCLRCAAPCSESVLRCNRCGTLRADWGNEHVRQHIQGWLNEIVREQQLPVPSEEGPLEIRFVNRGKASRIATLRTRLWKMHRQGRKFIEKVLELDPDDFEFPLLYRWDHSEEYRAQMREANRHHEANGTDWTVRPQVDRQRIVVWYQKNPVSCGDDQTGFSWDAPNTAAVMTRAERELAGFFTVKTYNSQTGATHKYIAPSYAKPSSVRSAPPSRDGKGRT